MGLTKNPKKSLELPISLNTCLREVQINEYKLSRSIENSGGILDFYTDHEHMMSTMDILPGELAEASVLFQNCFLTRILRKKNSGKNAK